MQRTYCKIVCDPYDPTEDRDQALAAGSYTKKYFVNDETVGRTDYFLPGIGLFKVSYHTIEPPFDGVLAEHFREYPEEVWCEFILPEGVSPDGLSIQRRWLYKWPGNLDEHLQEFLDQRGWVVRRVSFGPDGQPDSVEHPRYDEAGNVIGRRVCDAKTGEVWFNADYSDDD